MAHTDRSNHRFDESFIDRIAQLPIGLILLIVLIALVSYHFEVQPHELRAEQNRIQNASEVLRAQ